MFSCENLEFTHDKFCLRNIAAKMLKNDFLGSILLVFIATDGMEKPSLPVRQASIDSYLLSCIDVYTLVRRLADAGAGYGVPCVSSGGGFCRFGGRDTGGVEE